MHNKNCPDCFSSELKLIGILPDVDEFSGNVLNHFIEGGSLYLCLKCELKFRLPILDKSEYFELYNAGDPNWIFDEKRNDWKILKKFIFKRIPAKGKILDFGCNMGDILYRLPNIYEKYGIEINKISAEITRSKINTTVWNGFDDLPSELELDIIYTIDVIEHLSSPRDFVINALSHIKTGGYIVLMSGDSNNFFWKISGSKWWYSVFPEHISFISKSWAIKLCKSIDNLEVAYVKNYYNTGKPLIKRFEWFLIWILNFVSQSVSKYLFKILPKLRKSGMGNMKHFGRNFSADHIIICFRKS
jgi:SAM-dependent methyltransferase